MQRRKFYSIILSEERSVFMRMRNPKDRDIVLDSCEFYYTDNDFNNNNEIHLEIGMGKADFIIGMAKKYPEINFIGIEKYKAVASIAIKKIRNEKLDNIRVLVADVNECDEILKNKISKIYLNFSDPWPKDRHAKRRLTHENFLKLYDNFFISDKIIAMKTDNDDLFAYSVDSFKSYGYNELRVSYDLHSENIENVITEYEDKFSSMGVKIKYTLVKKENK